MKCSPSPRHLNSKIWGTITIVSRIRHICYFEPLFISTQEMFVFGGVLMIFKATVLPCNTTHPSNLYFRVVWFSSLLLGKPLPKNRIQAIGLCVHSLYHVLIHISSSHFRNSITLYLEFLTWAIGAFTSTRNCFCIFCFLKKSKSRNMKHCNML